MQSDIHSLQMQTSGPSNILITNNAHNVRIIDFGLADLDAAEVNLGSVRAKTGSRMNSAQTAILTNTDFEIANKDTRSKIQDVDYAEAMTELTKQDTALQAAQATFTRITRLSLFDYLR